jgi:hypothetical protein
MTLPNLAPSEPAVTGPAGPPRSGRQGRWWLVVAALVAVVGVVIGLVVARHVSREVPGRPTAAAPAHGYAADCLAVGAAVSLDGKPGSAALKLFEQVDQTIGPLTMRRSFDPVLPPSFQRSAAAGDAAAGLHSFVSWKPPNGDHRGAAQGRYDRQITAWAKSVPRTGIYATAFHEPENNMSAADYVAFERHVYTVVKAANPTIHFGPVYMGYWWDPTKTSHYIGDPATWWPGPQYADFVGLDWYGTDPTPMTTSRSFQTWYDFVAPTGLPLVIPEYGQYQRPSGEPADPAKLQARVDALRQDAEWISAHPQFTVWLYWEGGPVSHEYRLTDPASQEEWRSIAGSGCRA